MDRRNATRGESSDAGAASPDGDGNSPSSAATQEFSCHICLDTAQEPVVSRCGHLFCWPCIHRWMGTERGNECPVCKAGISEENVVPIYLGGSSKADDPRTRSPPRPQGQRPAPEPNPAGLGGGGLFGGGGGLHFSLGVGAFPFFGVHTNLGAHPPPPHHANVHQLHQLQEESTLSKILLMIGLFCIFYLIL